MTAPALVHDTACESELTSHGYTPCRCAERVAICYCRKNPCQCVPVPLAARIPLDHDYGDDATLLANFLTVPFPTLRQQAAITLLAMAVREAPPVVVDEDPVDVCAAAIFNVTCAYGPVSPAACATLAHLACRAFARHQHAEPGGPYEQHALLAIGEACADVIGPPL